MDIDTVIDVDTNFNFNGFLDFPPEILIFIYKRSEWNLSIRELNKYFYTVYSRYHAFKVEITNKDDLNYVRDNKLNVYVKVSNFIPDNLDRINLLYLRSFFFRDMHARDKVKLDQAFLGTPITKIENSDILITRIKDSGIPISPIELDLSDNYIGNSYINYLSRVIFNTPIVSLNLGENIIGNDGALLIEELLSSNSKLSSTLTKLNLSSNRIDTFGSNTKYRWVNYISPIQGNLNKIESLNLSNNLIRDDTILDLIFYLSSNPFLEELDLSGNKISIVGITILSEYLANKMGNLNPDLNKIPSNNHNLNKIGTSVIPFNNHALHILKLNHNYIGDEGIKVLFSAFSIDHNLTSLFLGENEIGNKGAKIIAKYLKEDHNLITLVLSDNYEINKDGVIAIANSLRKNKTLQYLNLRGCDILDEGDSAIESLLQVNTTLKKVDTPFNYNRRRLIVPLTWL